MKLSKKNPIDNDLIKEQTSWERVVKHHRYLSNFNANIIQVDISHHQATSKKIRVINLNDMTIAGHGGDSVATSPVALTNYPHLIDTFKVIINTTLKTCDKGNVGVMLTMQINTTRLLIAWMMRKGVYRLADFNISLMETFLDELGAAQSWWHLLDIQSSLDSIIQNAIIDTDFGNSLIGATTGQEKTVGLRLNTEVLTKLVGLPFQPGDIPNEFREKLGSVLNKKIKLSKTNREDYRIGQSRMFAILGRIRALANIPAPFDRFTYQPIGDIVKTSRMLTQKETEGRTPNLGIDQAANLLSEAIKWVYEYSPGILTLIQGVREEIYITRGQYKAQATKSRKAKAKLLELVEQVKETHALPPLQITTLDQTYKHIPGTSLHSVVRTLQAACFILVAINHGRRKNEVLGEQSLPYGLYYGCCKTVDELLQVFSIEIYIEKTYQDWHTMPCNVMVRDAVLILEKIWELHQPPDSPAQIPEDHLKARHQYLFEIATLIGTIAPPEGGRPKPTSFLYKAHSEEFLSLCGLNKSSLDFKTHPFRRLFAILYMYRYNHSQLTALSQHLRHLNPSSTRIYISDPDNRDIAASIDGAGLESPKQKASIEAVWEEVQDEYFVASLTAILEGKAVGGMWPKLVMAQVKRLSRHIEFQDATLIEKARVLHKSYKSRGFKPEPKSNGDCMAGTAVRTARSSNCYDPESRTTQPEKASAKMCHGCINLCTTENHITHQTKYAEELEMHANDISLPLSVRGAKAKNAKELRHILHLEQEMQSSNQKFIADCMARFATFFDRQND